VEEGRRTEDGRAEETEEGEWKGGNRVRVEREAGE
jgi:hypothetical protein